MTPLTLVIGLSFLILAPGNRALPLFDRDEPHFNNDYRFDKPPLTYWWMARNYFLLGVNEFAARLHATVSATAIAACIFLMGRSLLSFRTGLMAAVAWCVSVQVAFQGRFALADMPMVLCLLFSHWALFVIVTSPGRRRYDLAFYGLYVSMGIGFLAKGPVALLFPLLTLLFYRSLFFRTPLAWRQLGLVPGLAITMGIITIWGLPALWMTGGAYWDVGIGYHIIDRGLGAFHRRITLPFYYVLTAPLSLCPSFPWLLIGLWKAWRCQDEKRAFLLSWMLGPYLVFGFYATQLPHYVLPAFPAIFLLGFRHTRQGHEGRILVHAYYGLYSVLVVGGIGLLVLSGHGGQMLAVKLCVGGLVGILMCYLLFALCVERQKWLGAAVTVFMVPVFNVLLSLGLQPITLSRHIGTAVRLQAPQGKAIGVGYEEPGLVFLCRSFLVIRS